MPQLLSLCSRAHEPQLLSLHATTTEAPVPQLLKPVLCNKRSHRSEKPSHRNEELAPARRNERKPAHSNKDPMQPKINKLKNKKQKKTNLVKQSLYLQTGEFKGIIVPLNSEHFK